MSGGVRNLRAMFENKEESSISPPDRGRSPAGSIGGSNNGTSPRPLSKVRTSFVAVERSGQLGSQWGLRKESGTDPSLATRRGSFSIDEETDPKAVADRKHFINSELSARKSSAIVAETIPEFAIETPPVEAERSGYFNGNSLKGKVTRAESKAGAILDKKTPAEDHKTRPPPGDVTGSAAVSSGAALKNGGGLGGDIDGNISGRLQPASPTKITAKTAPAGRATKPGPISTAPSSTTAKIVSKSTKSPTKPKTPTTPAKPPTSPGKSSKASTSKPIATSSTKVQAKPADMKAARSTVSSSTTSKPAAQPTTSSTVSSMSENKPPHISSSTGFHKPRPKSPTKPAKLPASMTAPTASSLSKVAPAATPSRQSLAPATKTVSRSRSHASLSQKQELHQKQSKLDGDRPALGRPSTSTLKKQPSRQSLPKQIALTDESFLARMMRPTTSSASKTTEKIITPPRVKLHTRPTTREGPAAHKPHQGLNGSPSTRKLPPAAKEPEKEGPNAGHSTEVEGATVSAIDINQVESAATQNEQATIPNNTEDGPVAPASDEKEHVEDASAEDNATFASGTPTVTEDKVGVNQPVKTVVHHEEPKPNLEALQSIQEESNTEKVVNKKEPEDVTTKSAETTVETEEPVDIDELKEIPAAVEGPDVLEGHETTNGVPEQLKENSKIEDVNTAA